jgi:hypothetical protein
VRKHNGKMCEFFVVYQNILLGFDFASFHCIHILVKILLYFNLTDTVVVGDCARLPYFYVKNTSIK